MLVHISLHTIRSKSSYIRKAALAQFTPVSSCMVTSAFLCGVPILIVLISMGAHYSNFTVAISITTQNTSE